MDEKDRDMRTQAKKGAAKAADLDVRMAGLELGLLLGLGNQRLIKRRLAALKKQKAAMAIGRKRKKP